MGEVKMRRGIIWYDELKERLKGLYATGLSSSQIAAEMNCGLSRNAIIGQVHRLKLVRGNGHENRKPSGRSPRHQAYKPREKRATIRFIRCNSNSNAMRVVDIVEFDAAEMRCAEVEPKHVGLLDLDSDGCRYPFGDSPFTFCNHKQLAGSSYCPSHFFLSIGPGTSSEKAATKISAVHLEPFA
jgi:GcrA cell cycle regulator